MPLGKLIGQTGLAWLSERLAHVVASLVCLDDGFEGRRYEELLLAPCGLDQGSANFAVHLATEVNKGCSKPSKCAGGSRAEPSNQEHSSQFVRTLSSSWLSSVASQMQGLISVFRSKSRQLKEASEQTQAWDSGSLASGWVADAPDAEAVFVIPRGVCGNCMLDQKGPSRMCHGAVPRDFLNTRTPLSHKGISKALLEHFGSVQLGLLQAPFIGFC